MKSHQSRFQLPVIIFPVQRTTYKFHLAVCHIWQSCPPLWDSADLLFVLGNYSLDENSRKFVRCPTWSSRVCFVHEHWSLLAYSGRCLPCQFYQRSADTGTLSLILRFRGIYQTWYCPSVVGKWCSDARLLPYVLAERLIWCGGLSMVTSSGYRCGLDPGWWFSWCTVEPLLAVRGFNRPRLAGESCGTGQCPLHTQAALRASSRQRP